MRLWYEGRNAHAYIDMPAGQLLRYPDRLKHHLRYRGDILRCFCRQPSHKVELQVMPAFPEKCLEGLQISLLGEVLVYYGPQPVRACLRRDSESGLAHGPYL